MLGAYTSEKESRQGSFQWRLKLLVPYNGHRNISVCTCDASWDTEYNRREHVSSSVVHTALYIAVLCIMPIVCAKKKKTETIVAQQILNQMLILLVTWKNSESRSPLLMPVQLRWQNIITGNGYVYVSIKMNVCLSTTFELKTWILIMYFYV